MHLLNETIAKGGQHLTVLENGLTVITVDTGSRLAYAELTVASGLNRDRIPGTAHFLEHLLLEGPARSARHPLMRGIRASVDGSTDWDFTDYSVSCWSKDAQRAVAALVRIVFDYADRALNQRAFDVERPIIFSEIEGGMRSRHAFRELQKLRFPDDPLRHVSAAGSHETLQMIDLASVREYYEREYRPSNALLIVAGGIDHLKIVDRVRRIPLPASPEPRVPYQCNPPVYGRLRTKIDTADPFMEVYFERPKALRDVAILETALDLLDRDTYGLLWKALRRKHGKYHVRASVHSSDVGRAPYVRVGTRTDHAYIERMIRKAIETLASGKWPRVLHEDVLDARRRADVGAFEGTESKQSQGAWAGLFGRLWLCEEPYEAYIVEEYEDGLREEIQRVVTDLLNGKRGTIICNG